MSPFFQPFLDRCLAKARWASGKSCSERNDSTRSISWAGGSVVDSDFLVAEAFFFSPPVLVFLVPAIVDVVLLAGLVVVAVAVAVVFPLGAELFEKSQAGGADMGNKVGGFLRFRDGNPRAVSVKFQAELASRGTRVAGEGKKNFR